MGGCILYSKTMLRSTLKIHRVAQNLQPSIKEAWNAYAAIRNSPSFVENNPTLTLCCEPEDPL